MLAAFILLGSIALFSMAAGLRGETPATSPADSAHGAREVLVRDERQAVDCC